MMYAYSIYKRMRAGVRRAGNRDEPGNRDAKAEARRELRRGLGGFMLILLSDGAGLTSRQCATVLDRAGHRVEALSPAGSAWPG